MRAPLKLGVHIEEWATKAPFRIAGLTRTAFRVVVVELSDGECVGRGEGLPVRYLGETVEGMVAQIEARAALIEAGMDRPALQELLPAGGARNALDSALWDLSAKQVNTSIWALTGVVPASVVTAYTLGIEATPEESAAAARLASGQPVLKVKLDGRQPYETVEAIRKARPDATLMVDANQSWTFDQLTQLAPRLVQLDVRLIEQPLPRGQDAALEHYTSPIPLCADESCQHRGELAAVSRGYRVINIKLDKCGGLTEGFELAREARARGLELFVGNMGGTSLSIAPAFVLAQSCRYVDLDGPLILRHDRLPGLRYSAGEISGLSPQLWG